MNDAPKEGAGCDDHTLACDLLTYNQPLQVFTLDLLTLNQMMLPCCCWYGWQQQTSIGSSCTAAMRAAPPPFEVMLLDMSQGMHAVKP